MKPMFLVTDSVPHGFMDRLHELGFETVHHTSIDNSQIGELLPGLTGIVTWSGLYLGEDEFAQAPLLKYILRPGSGLDNIDLVAAKARGIVVMSTPEANAPAVAEHALACLLAMRRNIVKAASETRHFQWVRHENTGPTLYRETVGIIGYGHTGPAFARLLKAFGCRLLVYDPYVTVKEDGVEQCSREEIQRAAGVVSLHVPLNAETKEMVNSRFISGFHRPFWLINTSRGKNVHLPSLLDGIRNGKVLGAAIDVLPNERLHTYSQEERALFDALQQTGKVIITPHIAGWSDQARLDIFMNVLDKFAAHARLSNAE